MWGGGTFRPVMSSQGFSETGLPGCALHSVSQCFSLPLGGTGWLEWAAGGYFPSPGQLESDHTPAGKAVVN